MTPEATRQRKLAASIDPKFIPFGRHSSFSPPPMPLHEQFFDARMCDAVWWPVATMLGHIDHAWLFGMRDGCKEPWGFVTEPYLSEEEANAAVYLATDRMPDWGVTFQVWGKEHSSWNPGGCMVIIASFEPYSIRRLVQKATAWMLS